MSRRSARETAMHVYYQMEIHNEYKFDISKIYIDEAIDDKDDKKYIEDLVDIFIKNRETIDQTIKDNLKGWSIDRISKIDLSILRIGLAEIMYRDDIPIKVSINEAIELGKKFGTDDSAGFISGLLGFAVKEKEINE